MKVTPLPLLLLVLLVVGCSNISIEAQFFQPAEATATALALPAATASTSDRDVTAAIERAVRLTLTAAAPTPTHTLPPSPGAFLIALPEDEAVEGWEWPEGAVVHLAIDDPTTAASPDFEQDGIMAVTTWGDPSIYVRFDFAGIYDLKARDIVMVTDGATGRTHLVRNLSVMAVDAASDTVAGTADTGAVIQVWPHGFDPIATVQVTAGADGAWLADFAGVFDLAAGTGGRSRILDEVGNATAVNWTAPTPLPSPRVEPTTAIPPTETPAPTATTKPAPGAGLSTIRNLALNQSTRASNSLQSPATMAVDGNTSTGWGAGAGVPQWIEIDLGAPATITRIRLLVTQHPYGDTLHRILVRSVNGDFSEAFRFEKYTYTGLWLVFAPEKPLEDVQIMRIETLQSPSWVGWLEIQVLGER